MEWAGAAAASRSLDSLIYLLGPTSPYIVVVLAVVLLLLLLSSTILSCKLLQKRPKAARDYSSLKEGHVPHHHSY
jgi:hypothetical protein